MKPVVLGLLQNQWFKDPAGSAKLLERYKEHEGGYWPGRRRFIRDMLFFGCLTGKRVEQTLGEELCGYEGIVWEETSLHLGGKASSVYPPDPEHIVAVLSEYKPQVVIAFGQVARVGLALEGPRAVLQKLRSVLLQCPHPAARGPDVLTKLRACKEELDALLEGMS